MDRKICEFFCLENEFFNYVLVIIGTYIAQTAFKISATRKDGTFDWKLLINGIIDYAIYFIGVLIFFFAGQLISELEIIPLGDKKLTIDDALTAVAYTLMVAQALKCFKNIRETFGVKEEDIVVNDKSATIPIGKEG